MSNKKISIPDRFEAPYHVLFVDGIAYAYAYTMVPKHDFSSVGRFRSYPLHLFSPEDMLYQVQLDLSLDFPVVIVGGNNEKIYKFPSWFAFQSSHVAWLTADWTEVLAD